MKRLDDIPLPRIPGYSVLETIGAGGMGVVFKARQHETERVVAIKLMLAGREAHFEELARFRIEAGAIACISHPNVVLIHEVAVHDGYPYLCLEYIDGPSLRARMGGRLQSPRWSAHVLKGVAEGIGHAHDNGILHRDLKPDNVLLTADDVPKITDFGLAKFSGVTDYEEHFDLNASRVIPYFDVREGDASNIILSGPHDQQSTIQRVTRKWNDRVAAGTMQSGLSLDGVLAFAEEAERQRAASQDTYQEVTRISVPGVAMGTPSYMSPEQFMGDVELVGPPTDVYAIGCMLHELLTGRRPFEANDIVQLRREVFSKPAPEIRRDVSTDLKAIYKKCTAKDPKDRYEDGNAVAEDLQRFLEGRSLRARYVAVLSPGTRSDGPGPDATTLPVPVPEDYAEPDAYTPVPWQPGEHAVTGPKRPRGIGAWFLFAARVFAACTVVSALKWTVVYTAIGVVCALAAREPEAVIFIGLFGAVFGFLLGAGNALIVLFYEFDNARANPPLDDHSKTSIHQRRPRTGVLGCTLIGALFGLCFGWFVRFMLSVADLRPSEPLNWEYVLLIAAGWAIAGAVVGLVRRQHPPTDQYMERSLARASDSREIGRGEKKAGAWLSLAIVLYIGRVIFTLVEDDRRHAARNTPAPPTPRAADLLRAIPMEHQRLMNAEMEQEFREAILADDIDAMAHFNLGVVLAKQERLEEAIDAFKKSGELNADISDLAYANQGDLLQRLGRYEEAVDAYNESTTLDPSNGAVFFKLAAAHYRLKQLDQAETECLNAVKLEPLDPQIRCAYGDILLAQHKFDEARVAFEVTLQLDQNHTAAQERLNALNRRTAAN